MLSSGNQRYDMTQWLPQANHVQTIEKHRIQFRQMRPVFQGVVHQNEPSQEQGLGCGRWFVSGGTEAADNLRDQFR